MLIGRGDVPDGTVPHCTYTRQEGRHMMWAGWGFHWIWMVVFWAAVIALVVWAVSRLTPTDRDRGANRARDVLDERYARGEIDEEEYRRRRSQLDG
jgi:putative membrane protein